MKITVEFENLQELDEFCNGVVIAPGLAQKAREENAQHPQEEPKKAEAKKSTPKKAEAKEGRFLCVKVELKDGYEVVSVKNGEVAGNLQGGYYCFSGSTAGEVTYTIVTKASVAA